MIQNLSFLKSLINANYILKYLSEDNGQNIIDNFDLLQPSAGTNFTIFIIIK